MIYTGLLSLLLAEYAANQKCSAVLLICRFNIPAGGSSTMQVIKRADEIIIPFFIQSVIY